MSSERSHNLNPASEPAPDRKSEVIANFVRTPIGKIVLSILGIVVIGGSAWGIKELGKNKEVNTPAQQERTLGGTIINSSESETKTPEVAEVLPTVESLELDASLINNPGELVKTLDNRITDWINAGATPENAKKAYKSSVSMDKNAAEDAKKYDDIFIEALMADGWESNAFNKKFVDDNTLSHKYTLSNYYRTSMPDLDPNDKEPYKRWINSTDIIVRHGSEAQGYITISIKRTFDDNHENNTATSVGETSTNDTFTFVKEGDSLKIDDITLENWVGL